MNDEGDRASAVPRVLRALVEELRESETPPMPWDDMEARLLARIESTAPNDATDAPDEGVGTASVHDGRAEILVPWDDEPENVDDALPVVARVEPRAALPDQAAAAELMSARRVVEAKARSGTARRWSLFAFAAVAVAAAWLFVPRGAVAPMVAAEPLDLAAVAVEPRLGDAFDLASLRAGDVVEASEGPVSFGRAGVLRWTLSAGGRVRVVSGVGREEPRHVLALESGALDVDVVPLEDRKPEDGTAVLGAERFVVEVGDARVAVHGTAFRVVRSSRGVVLDVVRGVVAVGPLAGGEGAARLMEAPARAAFALDGSAYRDLPRVADGDVGKRPTRVVAHDNGDERYAGAAHDGSAASRDSSSSQSVPATPAPSKDRLESASTVSPGRVEARDDSAAWTADRVRREVSACIARTGDPSGDGARVIIASSVVIDVDAAGSTRAVRFDPPIRPDLQACGQAVLAARFPAGTGRLLVPLEVRLGAAK